MKRIINLIFIAGSMGTILSCNNPSTNATTAGDSSSFDIGKGKSAIEDQNAKFVDAVKKGDSNTLAAQYAPDAEILPSQMNAIPAKDISTTFGSFMRSGMKDLTLTVDNVNGDKDMLIETGHWEMPAPGNKTEKGLYVVVWKNYDGKWMRFRDIWNDSAPMTAAK